MAHLDRATKAEKAIASYFLTNLQSLPFETAATVATKIGISEATIGRFCRSPGFAPAFHRFKPFILQVFRLNRAMLHFWPTGCNTCAPAFI